MTLMKSHAVFRLRSFFLVAFCLLFIAVSPAFAQTSRPRAPQGDITQAYFREFYTKYEYKIPMRDGVKLFVSVYAPKDQSTTYPILLTRTPYSAKPYGEDVYPEPGGMLQQYAREQFIFVTEDVRGRYASEGQFVHMRPQRAADAGPK